MCQAYEAERSFICWMEDNKTVAGFKAHRDGESRNAPGYGRHMNRWLHGWDCREEGLIPYAVETRFFDAHPELSRYHHKMTMVEADSAV